MEFFATCGSGLEKVLGDELRRIGVRQVRPLGGGVSFQGRAADAYKALLWSRVASRVLLNLTRIEAGSSQALYEGVKTVAWEEHIGPEATIVVDARGTNEALHDTRFTALRAKDAICDYLRDLRGIRPDVDVHNPDVRINIALHKNRATISIDLTGAALDQRGYRAAMKPQGAPIRENLAAATLLLAGWHQRCKDGSGLLNPYCGPGTVAIEAAMIAGDIAPGSWRQKWGFEGWLGHDQEAWDALIAEADERAEQARVGMPPIIATDEDPRALAYARACAKQAGLEGLITFAPAQEAPSVSDMTAADQGLLVCNLSGAEQFASLAQLPSVYAQLRAQVAPGSNISGMALLTSDQAIDGSLGYAASSTYELRNGANMVVVRTYNLEDAVELATATIKVGDRELVVNDAAAEQFATRLAKVFKLRRKWAKRENISSYRLYDADLPDYNMAIDVYGGAGPDEGKTFVHVAEYAAPKKIDPDKVARRLSDALTVIPAVLGVDPADVFVKRRLRAKGGSQYANAGDLGAQEGRKLITQENGLLFEVELADRLDTGIFLDHRDTRQLLRKLSAGKSVLNLFAYTGTASVYAAAGKAKFTTTVDMSNTYQEWTRRNFELNGLADEHMELERADVLSWVQEKRHTRERWDLVFVDPPTFSNSSKMGRRTWDVQEDHAELLIGVSRLLTRTGAIMFSCNLRGFKLDAEKLAKAGVVAVDITDKTIPEDFARGKAPHCCFLLRRG